MKNFHARMTERRKKAGLSFDRAYLLGSAFMPEDEELSVAKIRRMEGRISPVIAEENASPFAIRALALAYECEVSDLSPIAVRRLRERLDLLERPFRWIAA